MHRENKQFVCVKILFWQKKQSAYTAHLCSPVFTFMFKKRIKETELYDLVSNYDIVDDKCAVATTLYDVFSHNGLRIHENSVVAPRITAREGIHTFSYYSVMSVDVLKDIIKTGCRQVKKQKRESEETFIREFMRAQHIRVISHLFAFRDGVYDVVVDMLIPYNVIDKHIAIMHNTSLHMITNYATSTFFDTSYECTANAIDKSQLYLRGNIMYDLLHVCQIPKECIHSLYIHMFAAVYKDVTPEHVLYYTKFASSHKPWLVNQCFSTWVRSFTCQDFYICEPSSDKAMGYDLVQDMVQHICPKSTAWCKRTLSPCVKHKKNVSGALHVPLRCVDHRNVLEDHEYAEIMLAMSWCVKTLYPSLETLPQVVSYKDYYQTTICKLDKAKRKLLLLPLTRYVLSSKCAFVYTPSRGNKNPVTVQDLYAHLDVSTITEDHVKEMKWCVMYVKNGVVCNLSRKNSENN